jgi:hypothetical protein
MQHLTGTPAGDDGFSVDAAHGDVSDDQTGFNRSLHPDSMRDATLDPAYTSPLSHHHDTPCNLDLRHHRPHLPLPTGTSLARHLVALSHDPSDL